jgi:hypothetical protein
MVTTTGALWISGPLDTALAAWQILRASNWCKCGNIHCLGFPSNVLSNGSVVLVAWCFTGAYMHTLYTVSSRCVR